MAMNGYKFLEVSDSEERTRKNELDSFLLTLTKMKHINFDRINRIPAIEFQVSRILAEELRGAQELAQGIKILIDG